MSKKATPRRWAENESSASVGSLRISPQKLNLIAGLIRGKSVHEALDQLTFCRKRAAKQVYDLLVSAVSNAENNHELDMDRLVVAEAYVGKSLMMKRFHARGRGRGARILKPFSNMRVVLRQEEVAA